MDLIVAFAAVVGFGVAVAGSGAEIVAVAVEATVVVAAAGAVVVSGFATSGSDVDECELMLYSGSKLVVARLLV